MMFAPKPWMTERACAGIPVSVFFPSDSHGVAVAKKICGRCPVRPECLEHAIDNGELYGIWGGRSERQRKLGRSGGRVKRGVNGFDRATYMREWKRRARAADMELSMPSTEFGRRLVLLLMGAA